MKTKTKQVSIKAVKLTEIRELMRNHGSYTVVYQDGEIYGGPYGPRSERPRTLVHFTPWSGAPKNRAELLEAVRMGAEWELPGVEIID
jgi:hypothetical protein